LGGGVNKLKLFANYIENYTPRNGLPAASVYSFLEDRRHRIWIGTNGGGLAILDGDSLVIIDVRHGLPNNVVYTLAIDSSQAIWIGTEAGVVRIPSPARMPQLLDKKQWQIFTTKNGLPNDRIRNIYCTPQGEVWLGTYGGGAVRYFEQQLTVLAEKEGMQNTSVQALLQDRQGRLWIATNGGLFYRSAAGQKVSRITENLPLEEIYCIFEDHAGDLWFWRRGGAACYLDGKFLIWNTANGLSDNVVYFIAEDREHRLWLGTNAGVDCFNAETVKAFKQDQFSQITAIKSRPDSLQKALPFFNLAAVHGLADNECNTRATLCDRDGNLWFGTASGATRLNPDLLPPVTPSPRVHIQAMEIDGIPWLIRDGLEFPARAKTSLTFHFATLSFIDEKHARSEYYLEGFDDDWTGPLAETHARYTNLSLGSYKFHLRGVNAFGVSSQAAI
jgi:ligand-binding sensor domain-containing protein